MTIEISTSEKPDDIEQDWQSFCSASDSSAPTPDLEISDIFSERSVDAGTTSSIVEIGAGFVMGVGSGLIANWLTHLIQRPSTKAISIGDRRISGDAVESMNEDELLATIAAAVNELASRSTE